MFCLCADGYEGKNCETGEKLSRRAALLRVLHAANGTSAAALVKNGHCYEGLGLFYRGTASQSESGRTCQEWDPQTRERYLTSDINSGRHNYCRWASTITGIILTGLGLLPGFSTSVETQNRQSFDFLSRHCHSKNQSMNSAFILISFKYIWFNPVLSTHQSL